MNLSQLKKHLDKVDDPQKWIELFAMALEERGDLDGAAAIADKLYEEPETNCKEGSSPTPGPCPKGEYDFDNDAFQDEDDWAITDNDQKNLDDVYNDVEKDRSASSTETGAHDTAKPAETSDQLAETGDQPTAAEDDFEIDNSDDDGTDFSLSDDDLTNLSDVADQVDAERQSGNTQTGDETKDFAKKETMIKRVGSQYRVMSESGKPMGTYFSQKAAEKRLQEIEYFKSHPEKNCMPGAMNVAMPNELKARTRI